MKRRPRIRASLVAALLVGGATFPLLPGAAAQEEEIRTTVTGLFGYTGEAQGSPFTIQFFDQAIPIPTDPGEPQFETTTSFTNTTLETGPTSRGLASSTWPGAAFGDGFPTICSCEEEWRVKADARYPEQPHTADQSAPGAGSGMQASALGLDVWARAESSQSPNEENAGYGSVSSFSTSTVPQGEALSLSIVDSASEDVSLMGGIITIDSVRTVLEARSDGETASTVGQTEVSGMTIGGQGYTVDEEGARPVEDEEGGEGLPIPDNPGNDDAREALGIEVFLAEHEEEVNGNVATRKAGGLRIVVNSSVMKNALTSNLPVNDIISNMPDDLKVHLLGFLQFGPEVHYVFARGLVSAAATPSFSFDIDPPLPPPPPPPAPPAPPAVPPVASDFFVPPAPGTGVFQPPVVEEPAPEVAPPAPVAPPPVLAVAPLTEGIPASTYVLWLALVALIAYALPYLTDRAMGGASSPFCTGGAPKTVPELRNAAPGGQHGDG